jgi:hypothetical protein
MRPPINQRHIDLHQLFGTAWRLTHQTNLIDDAPDTSTDTFAVSGWPLENPPSTIAGVTQVEPTSLGSGRTDPARRLHQEQSR